MLGCGRKPRADHPRITSGASGFATKHVAELSRLVVQRIVAHTKKSMNINSATGRRPVAAAPAAIPMMADSVMGVSITRSEPNCVHSPLVTPSTPPKAYLRLFGRISAMTATQVFTDEHHAFIAFHFLSQGFLDRFTIGFYCHSYHPQYET
jgi:hypothetical protein